MAYQLYYEGKFKYEIGQLFYTLQDASIILNQPSIQFRNYQCEDGDLLGTNRPYKYVEVGISGTSYPVTVTGRITKYDGTALVNARTCYSRAEVEAFLYPTLVGWIQSIINNTNDPDDETTASGFIYYSNMTFGDWIDELDDTVIYAYQLNCEKNRINKGASDNYLIPYKNITGYFREAVDLMNPQINVEEYDSYNYVYIPSLKRYYFVTNVMRNTKGLTTLYLHEDVLYSNKDLILLQSAYVTRSANSGSEYVIDDLAVMDYDKTVTYTTLTPIVNVFNDPEEYYDEDTQTWELRPRCILTTCSTWIA